MSEEKLVQNERKGFLFVIAVISVIVLGIVIVLTSMHIKSSNNERRLQEQLDLGDKYLSELDYEQAIVAYETAIEIDSMSVDAYLGLASVYEAQGDYDKAISVLEEGYLVTNDEILKQRQDEIKSLLIVEEEINSDVQYEIEDMIIFDIVDKDGDGKHDLDVEVINAIINEQISSGATVDANLDSEQYVWVSGRLTEIHWNDVGLSGSLSFNGLEKLTNIRCNNNQLNDLDVTNNFELIYLFCEGNQLTILDVSNNINLFELCCNYNQLSNLDVSNNLKLGCLQCANNNLRSLNIDNNKELDTLHCNSNSISDIDVSNNSRLQNFACGGNQLSSLDVTNNLELRYLACGLNELSEINLNSNLKLVQLDCGGNNINNLDVKNNVELTILYCSINQLNTLDLSNNNKLTHLVCFGNPIVNLDLNNNPDLIYLDCDDDVEYVGYTGEVQ